MDSLRLLIIGAGAIGCFVGGKLASAGHAVTLVGRARTAAALQTGGLQLYAADGTVERVPFGQRGCLCPGGLSRHV